MRFEFDPEKSVANQAKHGIDFVSAQEIWNDALFLQVPARATEEPRFIGIGKIGTKHWSAVFTVRAGRIRLISVRRSRDSEVGFYEGT